MLNVAVLGANGFIGSRLVEMLHLGELAAVRPIVRTIPSLARLSRFDLDCRIADAFDPVALTSAFQGCNVVIHAIAGDRQTILGTLASTYKAAQAAGIRRLIYLSSASVHGQDPPLGTHETSPLSDQQPLAYNNAKVQAERKLQQLRDRGTVELVILRPGIVLGPRSYWLTRFADDLLSKQAYLVNNGQGICNSVYVDNLVHAIYLSLTAASIDRQAFIIGDQERITWAEFYRPIAAALGFELEQIPNIAYVPPAASLEDRIEAVLGSKPSLAILSLFPDQWRRAARAALSTVFEPSTVATSPWDLPKPIAQPQPIATLEMALLHHCQFKLPHTHAQTQLGYQPIVSFPEACRRSIAWLAFAGYPVAEVDHRVDHGVDQPAWSSPDVSSPVTLEGHRQ